MGIRILACAVAATACASFTMTAQPPATKVGVISIQGAIVGTKEGQKASRELEARVQPRQKEFDQRQSELAQLEDQFNKGGNVLSEDKHNQLLRDIDQKKKKLERDVSDAKDDLTTEQQRLLQSLGQRLMALIEKYAKENGYALVLDVSNPNTPVLYASSAIDITQDIIAQYDKATPVGSAPMTTPAPTRTENKPAVPNTNPH